MAATPYNALCVLTAALLLLAQPANALLITDNYQGADSTRANGSNHGDVVGSTRNFQIFDMDVSMAGSSLNVRINTNFAGKAGTLFNSSTVGGSGIGYGDLFLSAAWNPFGSAPHALDDHTTGTLWTYGLAIDAGRFSSGDIDNGPASLYRLTGASNDDNAHLSNDLMAISTFNFRNGQEVTIDTASNATVDTGINGSWSVDSGNYINFKIDLAGSDFLNDILNSDQIALHWGFTCANDVIEGRYSVPEPGILLLLLSGLAVIRLRCCLHTNAT